jgi:hypothetical protein
MAQGQVLDFLTRLHVRTGSPGYLAAASSTFQSFVVPPVAGQPWVAWVTGGLLWLDEYPSSRTPTGDRTYNGHIFAAFGLYQYWLVTQDERAKQLAQGAFTTARTVYAAVRTPGWRNVYCLHDRCDSLRYHSTHVAQHLLLSTITGDPFFGAIADVFHADFPKPDLVGTVVMATGRHAGYSFDAAGGVTAARIITATSATSAPTDSRTKVKGRAGIWYRIAAGSLSGYSVQEVPRYTWVRGQHNTMAYLPWRSAGLLVALGELVQPATTSSGVLTKKSVALAAGTRFEIDGRALLNGIEHVRIAEGLHVGWWLPATSVRF